MEELGRVGSGERADSFPALSRLPVSLYIYLYFKNKPFFGG